MDTPFYNAVCSSPAMSIVKIRAEPRWYTGSPDLLGRPRDIAIDSLMETYSAHECEDIRDKVYAIVGIANNGSTIVVDYRKSAKDILLDVFYRYRDELEGKMA
jgi:hypothetical protein